MIQTEKRSIDKLLAAGKKIYLKTPASFRRIFWPAKLISLIYLLRMNQWFLVGKEVFSKQDLTIIYTGIEMNKNYLADLAFGSSHVEIHVGSRWLWQVPLKVKNGNCDCSLVITEVPQALRMLFGKKNCFYVPCWIRGEIDISANILSSIKKEHTLRSELRRIKKHGLQFEVTNEVSQFHKFYYDMYLPYATTRFGKGALIERYDFLKREFQKCNLLLVKKNGEHIAGGLVLHDKSGARLMISGVKDGNLDHVKIGASAAVYHFIFEYLQDKGYKKANLEGSRAFLKDGVLQYKRKWGLRIIGATGGKGFLIRPISQTAGLKGFLLNNPFVFIDKNGLKGAIFVGADQSLAAEILKKAYRDYYLEGVSKLSIYQFTQNNGGIQEVVLS
jgi:hypothetical protein